LTVKTSSGVYTAQSGLSAWVFNTVEEWDSLSLALQLTDGTSNDTSVIISNIVIGKLSAVPTESGLLSVIDYDQMDIYPASYVCPAEVVSLNLYDVVKRDYNSCLFPD
jgi:hypothetical protein